MWNVCLANKKTTKSSILYVYGDIYSLVKADNNTVEQTEWTEDR